MSRNLTFDEFFQEMDVVARNVDSASFSDVLEQECRPVLLADVEANFDNAATPGNLIAWAPHAPYTIKKYGPHPLLILSGKMKDAAIGGAGSINEATDRALRIGIDQQAVPYSPYQQDGTKKIPARTFFGASESAQAECAEIIADAGLQKIWPPMPEGAPHAAP